MTILVDVSVEPLLFVIINLISKSPTSDVVSDIEVNPLAPDTSLINKVEDESMLPERSACIATEVIELPLFWRTFDNSPLLLESSVAVTTLLFTPLVKLKEMSPSETALEVNPYTGGSPDGVAVVVFEVPEEPALLVASTEIVYTVPSSKDRVISDVPLFQPASPGAPYPNNNVISSELRVRSLEPAS